MSPTFFLSCALPIVILTNGCRTHGSSSVTSEVQNPSLRPLQNKEISDQVRDASHALVSIQGANDLLDRRKIVSDELLRKTKCIISMKVTKGALLLGGGGGLGLMACRQGAGWSAPSFVRTGQFDLSAAIGFEVLSIGIFITSDALAESHKGQLNISTKAYANAIAANAAAAVRLADTVGAVVIQNSEIGLYAGVGLSFQSIDHMQAQRNQVVYQAVLSGGEATDSTGRPCSKLLLPGKRAACVEDWNRRGGNAVSATAKRILDLRADQAPEITRPFNDQLRRLN